MDQLIELIPIIDHPFSMIESIQLLEAPHFFEGNTDALNDYLNTYDQDERLIFTED